MPLSVLFLAECYLANFYLMIAPRKIFFKFYSSSFNIFFQGDVTSQGLLLKREKATCYRRRHVLKKPKMRPCQFFVFEQSILICEVPVEEMNSPSPTQLEHFCDFKVNTKHIYSL